MTKDLTKQLILVRQTDRLTDKWPVH